MNDDTPAHMSGRGEVDVGFLDCLPNCEGACPVRTGGQSFLIRISVLVGLQGVYHSDMGWTEVVY